MILILGGTHEGSEIARQLKRHQLDYLLSVATELGLNYYGHDLQNTLMIQFTEASLKALIKEKDISLIIDATHPHAKAISQLAIECAKASQTTYWRFERQSSRDFIDLDLKAFTNLRGVDSMSSAIHLVSQDTGNILITGVKHIGDFYTQIDPSRCYFRMMPSTYSIVACENAGVPLDHRIAIKAPCPPQLTQCLFDTYDIAYFVFKESGAGSATTENLLALQDTRVQGIMIEHKHCQTPDVTRFESIDSIVAATVNKLKTFHKNMKQL